MPNTQVNTEGRIGHVIVSSQDDESLSGNTTRECVVCGTEVGPARRYCSIECYRVVQRSGSIVDRFWAKVRRTDHGCWLWTGSTYSSGRYGQFGITEGGRQIKQSAHRMAWELTHGPIPEGQSVLHRCDVPLCCNPDHLFLGDQLANMQDAADKGRLHVPRPRRQKLTPEQLDDIRQLDRSGILRSDIARLFGVSKAFISLYLNGKRRQYDAPIARREVA